MKTITEIIEPTPLFERAAKLMGFMSEEEAYTILVDDGITGSDAFLAVKAATILLEG